MCGKAHPNSLHLVGASKSLISIKCPRFLSFSLHLFPGHSRLRSFISCGPFDLSLYYCEYQNILTYNLIQKLTTSNLI